MLLACHVVAIDLDSSYLEEIIQAKSLVYMFGAKSKNQEEDEVQQDLYEQFVLLPGCMFGPFRVFQ